MLSCVWRKAESLATAEIYAMADLYGTPGTDGLSPNKKLTGKTKKFGARKLES